MILTDNSSDIIEFTRLYLAGFYSFVAIFYTIRIVLMKKSTNNELIFPGERFCATWWNHTAFRFFRAAIWMVCCFRFFLPSIDNYLGMMLTLQSTPIILTGNVLLSVGFLFTIFIHCKLGSKWRSGIDPNGPQSLIVHSFYRYSRNPMFLSVTISQIGFFLALPSVFSCVCLVIGLYTLHRQILAEEAHLALAFPDEYTLYCSNVRRWI